jgi:polyphenol oxidase
VAACWTGRAEGDQRAVESATLPPSVPAGLTLHRLRQIHGDRVVVVEERRRRPSVPAEGDALVASGAQRCLAVLTADCAAVALGSPEGVHGAVHAGWRGLVHGVIGRAVAAMREQGASSVVAGLGPTIHPCCYSFSPDDLESVARVVGEEARGRSAVGGPALDLPAAVRARLAELEVELVVDVDQCTACGEGTFSYRARGDEARQALYVWRDDQGRRG